MLTRMVVGKEIRSISELNESARPHKCMNWVLAHYHVEMVVNHYNISIIQTTATEVNGCIEVSKMHSLFLQYTFFTRICNVVAGWFYLIVGLCDYYCDFYTVFFF